MERIQQRQAIVFLGRDKIEIFPRKFKQFQKGFTLIKLICNCKLISFAELCRFLSKMRRQSSAVASSLSVFFTVAFRKE